jgi:peptidoglycan/xylan/chitin deacetylase (PgdA/CDA1 family)
MKKKIIIISSIVLLFIVTFFVTFYVKQLQDIKKIKKSYNKYIVVNKETSLYDVNHSIIGTVYENTYFELEDLNVKSKKDSYFKILGSDYYLYYGDVNVSEEQFFSFESKDYYVNLGKEITTGDVTNFYQNNNLVFTLNSSFSFEAIRKDDNYYYVSFLNKIFQIKIDEVVEDKDTDVGPISSYISVINYNSIMDGCNIKECITTDEFKNELNYLKENGNYSISVDDYKLWLNGYINLKEKAIFLTSKQDVNSISEEYGFTVEQNFEDLTYTDSDSKSEKGNSPVPRYNVINKTTLDIFKQIVNGDNVVYIVEKPILQVHSLPDINANATRIAVLNYHFFYDPEAGESCPDGNCKKVQDFENELNFLKKNNYKTLTMDEFTKWMYGEIELPARSVLITIDDGALGTGTHNGNKLIPILEKYQTHATLFLITGWWSIDNYRSPYLDIESHTNDMHDGNYCDGVPRGSKLLCSSKEQVLQDLSTSVEITGSKNAFCFPMYVYNDTTMQVLSEIGFKLAFVGGDYKATRSSDRYKIPRYHIYRDTSLDQFINMVS